MKTLIPRSLLVSRFAVACVVGCFGLLAVPGRAAAEENWAQRMFSETKHDFRVVGRGATAQHYFEFRNLYEEDVHVAAVRSSCGCTTPSVSKDTLATHETASIIATLNTSTFVGQKAATITVVFDQPYYAEVQLQVSGFIRTDVTFEPAEIDFGQSKPGEVKDRTIKISHRGNPGWRIQDVRSHCSDLAVKLSAPRVQPGLVEYEMQVRMKESMSEGDIRERLTLISNDTQFPTIEMAVAGHVRPALTVSPAAVSLGTATVGESVGKRLLVRADEPFAITEVRCVDKRFSFEIPEGKKKLHFVQLKFDSGDTPDRIAQKIEIVTDLQGGKTAECVATGTIR
ncbi:DUF1573 domain-containing protein [Aporhodopirellula aestuarii]|uniref:DUF1573 domain-containing protein n=1 Tax=Aporhodopirellula aestuarii TaxID=2950107 RepID=A0ABT0UDC1_9BACT|nr:DUF1573 domain-containing protein [Aporhodopirellula aestuarii]MCM2374792.1 DUF1573 domain-containing protein [Aporhodopirellula aestuarii]